MFRVRSLAAAVNRRFGVALFALAAGLAGCGGNSSRSEAYVPDRMVTFGDELSTITTTGAPSTQNGLKYSINAFNSTNTTTTDCSLSPVWPQVVAQYLGMVYAECNPSNVTPTALMRATAGDTVASVVAKMEAYRVDSANGVSPKTLVTVMAGQNDVIQAMEDYKNGASATDIRARMITLGTQLGDAINAMAAQGAGARVLFALLPRISTSPYARDTRFSDADRLFLQQLVDGDTSTKYDGFNGALRLRVTNNGRWAAMIVTEVYFSPYITRDISLTGLTNNSDAACTTAVPNCTTNTLVSGAASSTTTYLWATDRLMTPLGHAAIGNEGSRQIRQGAF